MPGFGNPGGANAPMQDDKMRMGASDAPPSPSGGDDDEQSNVSPEEQQQYEAFVKTAIEQVVLNDKVLPALGQRLKGDGDPIDGLAATTAMVVKRVDQAAREKGSPFSDDVLLHGGAEVMGYIAQLAEDAGIHSYSDEDIETAGYRAMDLYREMSQKDGSIDQQAAAQDFNELIQADKAGKLGQMIPGIEEKAAQMNSRGGDPQQQKQGM
ncbi:MAG: hypothetical protein VW405_04780 [Rhodospirillaceae bacterium]